MPIDKVAASKAVGWDARHVSIPSRERVLSLTERIKAGDQNAYETVLLIHRFAPSPTTAEETEAMNANFEAFKIGNQ